ncbi:glycosyltransferase family 2 protein [uncultured Desulfuromusa sp.]|uniref:glycosyltransferase family 2 protein n=1 Tax=uncultured Desulfuromusa sp. TaxID=219183 RepID=UPI002AA7BBFC|nr:glycosyltransferase family 2 protein [uncultured Desulfuromusa sp.]
MLSFLMPVKNERNYIDEALKSISDVSSMPYEVIVVDDGSTDGTSDFVESLDYDFINLIRTEGVGKVAAFNLAYENAKGDFFILLAGDDRIDPEVVEKRVDPLLKVEKNCAAITLCKLKSFSENIKYDGMVLPKGKNIGLLSGGCMAFNRAFGDLAFPIPSALVNEDSWLVLHARFSHVSISHVPEVGIYYRIHENNSYKRGVGFDIVNLQMWNRQKATFYYLDKYFDELTKKQIKILMCESVVYSLRYLGLPFHILTMPSVPLSQKVKAIFHTSGFMYRLRERFYKFFSGR